MEMMPYCASCRVGVSAPFGCQRVERRETTLEGGKRAIVHQLLSLILANFSIQGMDNVQGDPPTQRPQPPPTMSSIDKEFGQYAADDEAINDLIPPSKRVSSTLELQDEDDSSYAPHSYNTPTPAARKKSFLFYLATVQAFLIIYRTEVLLSSILAISVSIAFSSYFKSHRKTTNAFRHAHIEHDYTSIQSKYDLTLGSIDHWCLHGDDNECRCEDPLEPRSKRSSHKWENQHKENIKVATEALMTFGLASRNEYPFSYDDMWVDRPDDDWAIGRGPRFGDDDYGSASYGDSVGGGSGMDDDFVGDDGYGIPMESGSSTADVDAALGEEGDLSPVVEEGGGGTRRNSRLLGYFFGNVNEEREVAESGGGLDVVFVGDSITEQRQGTSHGKEVEDYVGIKEVFSKTFTKEKGGDFDGIAMGIAGDTAPNLLWRLMNGEMPYGLNPKVWWVGIGVNDLSLTGCSEEVVLLGILRVVEEIQNVHPDDIVVINSLLPVRRNEEGLLEHTGKHHEHEALKKKEENLQDNEMSAKRMHGDLWPSIVSINEELSKFASKHPKIKFFNADTVFVDERDDGKYLKLDLMADAVHPNLSGHKKWNSAIKKRLHEILKDKE